jgi:hypothetical protein
MSAFVSKALVQIRGTPPYLRSDSEREDTAR